MTINDENMLEKIHLNYRLTYIKDSILAATIDEPTNNTLNTVFNILFFFIF
jgi:hypothetical protein